MFTSIVIVAILVLASAGLVGFMVYAANRPALTMEEDKKALPGGGIDVLAASVTDVRAGGLVQASGFGDDFEDVNLVIDAYNRMTADDETWHELISEYKTRPVAVAWQERRSGTRVYAVLFQRAKELRDIGLEGSGLESLDSGAKLSCDNKEYSFARKGEALFHKGGEGFGKKFHYWDFEAEDGGLLRIERFVGAQATVSLARPMSAGDFGVLKVRG